MLRFLARLELMTARRDRRLLSDALASAEGGERLVGEVRAGGHQLLMDSHEIALAVGQ